MTQETLIDHHEEKINNIYGEIESLRKHIHEYSKGGIPSAEELSAYVTKLYRLEKDLRVSIEVRYSMINLQK